MFYSHPNCKVSWTRNKVVEKDGVVEIPITVFLRKSRIRPEPSCRGLKSNFIKTDVDWTTLDELKFFVQEAKKHNIRVMNLFMHSYSLIKFDKNFSHFEPDYDDIKKLESFLEYITNDKDIEVISVKEFHNRYQENPDEFEGSDYVPCIKSRIPWNQIPKKIFRSIFE